MDDLLSIEEARNGRPQRGVPLVLVTGATGYVGGRLLNALTGSEWGLRAMTRAARYADEWAPPGTEVVQADVMDPDTLPAALDGVDVAYYLIHSLESPDFARREAESARTFGAAARKAGVSRIVYLGGLGDAPDLSEHLASRQAVGRILRESGVPTIEFRASIIIGSGSLSFDLVRALVEKLPVMITPRWVDTLTQPLAVEDLISYLRQAASLPLEGSEVVEIGGPDIVSYGDIMREYARQRGLKRRMVPVPVLSPYLSGLWLGLVTPVYARIGRKLVAGLRNPTVVQDPVPARRFEVEPRGLEDAVARALTHEDREFAETRWIDSLEGTDTDGWGGEAIGTRLVDSRRRVVDASPERAFTPIRRIGGETGWYGSQGLWRIRGFLDLLAGGVGFRRGRRSADTLRAGDTVDFWRVEQFEPDRLLRLRAEMRLPGTAWLQFEVSNEPEGTVIQQTAMYDPRGLLGRLYWYLLWPVHQLVFSRLLSGIVSRIPVAGAG